MACNRRAWLLSVVATSGWDSPSSARRVASARRYSESASAYPPLSRGSAGRFGSILATARGRSPCTARPAAMTLFQALRSCQ